MIDKTAIINPKAKIDKNVSDSIENIEKIDKSAESDDK